MKHIDPATLNEWVDLDLDNALEPADRAQLQEHLSDHPELARERQTLGALHGLFDEGRIAGRADFQAQVMEALPAAPWRRRATSGIPVWGMPLAMLLMLTLGATWLIGNALTTHPIFEIGQVLADMTQTTLLAGSGMLFATWRGVGFGLEELVGGSSVHLMVFAVMVLCLDLLFVSMLRRRTPATVENESE